MAESIHWGVLAAFEAEAALVRPLLQNPIRQYCPVGVLWRGWIEAQSVALLQCGMGPQRAACAAEWLIQHFVVAGLMSVGFTGALQPHIARGDAVQVTQVQSVGPFDMTFSSPEPSVIVPDVRFTQLAAEAAAEASLVQHTGTLLSVSTIVSRPCDKQRLGRHSGALAVDMESHSIGRVAATQQVPFVVLRTIFDTYHDAIAFPAQALTTPEGNLLLGRFVGAMLHHPRTLAHVPRMWYNARVAGRNLSAWLRQLLPRLA